MKPTGILLFLLLVLLVAAPASAAHTTQVQIIRYASDGTTVANQTTVDVAWMESHLPVFGDGATPYLFQGPLTEITDYSNPAKWNPAEDSNVGKVNETIRGTYLTDLCNLVGGMQTGGVVKVVADDGYAKTFAYDNVCSPQARQGPMVLAWWTAREGYGYNEGIRLFFGADNSTNPYGLHVFGNQDMKETFDEKYWGWYGGKDALPSAAQLSNKWVAKVEIFPAPSTDWTVLLNGSIRREITKSYFESGLAWAGHRASYTDATGGVWEGMPLWRLVGYVDDGNEHSDLAFNRTLAEQGYTIRVIAADGYSLAFTSQEVAFSSNYIVANTLNGSALPVQINGKNVWPLRLIGTNASGGKSVSNITEIRVEGVPDPVPTPVPTTPVSTTPTPAVRPWTLQMTGYTDFMVTSQYWDEAMACGGHTGTYLDANGVEWMGLPLWRLIGLVDDQLGHEVLIGAYNATLADQGYVVRVIAADGYNRTFTSQEVKRSGDYLVASRMNGSALPEQVNGKYYWPLKLVGSNATGGKSIGNISEIRLEDLPIAPPVVDRPWTLKLSGYTNFTVSSDYFAQGIACGHSGTYVDTSGVTWTGLPLWRLVGLVDDHVGHEDLAGAYNDTLADQGYNITVIAGDGFSKTFPSQEVKRSGDFLVASKMNGSALPEQVNGKYYWPVKLVGASATGGKSIGNISEIRLDNLPIAPAPTTATPTPTQTAGPAVLFDGDLALKDGTFPCTAYNSGSTYQVQNLTPNGALELASEAGGFGYNVTDKKWVTMGTMLLDGAGGYNLDSTANRAWAYRVNGVVKNDFSSTEGISVYRIADGDLVEFWYGAKGGTFENALAVIRARVHVRQQITIFDGDVTLINGTFGAYAYNSGATIPVNNLTVHGALQAAAAKGGFSYKATDKKWSTMGTFLLDGVSTFDFNKTENTAWAYTLNGGAMNDYSADQGISVQQVKNGDQLVFYFCVKGAALEEARAAARVRVFVANDADFSLALKGALNTTVPKADFDASAVRVDYTDITGTWSGVPLWTLVGQVDDGDGASFNDTLAARNYTVKISAVDRYNKSLHSEEIARTSTFIIADRLNGAPLPETMWPLRLVGPSVPPSSSVAKVAEIELLGLPGEPIETVTPTPTQGGSAPYKPLAVPGRIEAEDYDVGGFSDTTPGNEGGVYRHDDVDIEKMAGASTPNVGWIRNGEWLAYTANVTTAGNYSLSARVASPYAGRTALLSVDGAPVATIAVPNTGGYERFTTVRIPATLTAGTHVLKLTFTGDGQNIDWIEFAPAAGPTPTQGGTTPYKPLTVPGRIEAEDYDVGGFSDTTPGNEGGMYRHDDVDIEKMAGASTPNVGWIRNGEWLAYTANVQVDGAYTLRARVASPYTGRAATFSVDGVQTGTIAVPNTGGWTTFATVTVPVTLTAGTHVMKLTFAGDGQNIDYVEFVQAAQPTVTTTTAAPSAGAASFTAAPLSAPKDSAVKFTLAPTAGKTVKAVWWSFDRRAHLNTWNSRDLNPTFFYPAAGTYTPLVKITYTDGSTETVERANYVTAR